jgi:hypothetical protein
MCANAELGYTSLRNFLKRAIKGVFLANSGVSQRSLILTTSLKMFSPPFPHELLRRPIDKIILCGMLQWAEC